MEEKLYDIEMLFTEVRDAVVDWENPFGPELRLLTTQDDGSLRVEVSSAWPWRS